MKLLLDTHVFLRYFISPKKLRREALAAIESGNDDVFVSAASVWEIAIKVGLGKLDVPGNLSQYVQRRISDTGFIEVPVTIDHALAVRSLPAHHADPFDRIMVAQSQIEGFTFVTADRKITQYDLRCLKAW